MDTIATTRKQNLLRVIYLSFCYLMLFTAYIAAQNLMTQIFNQLGLDGLAQLCFFFMACTIILSSLVSTHIHKLIPLKYEIVCGGATHVLFLSGGALATFCDKYKPDSGICDPSFIYFANITFALVMGVGISFFWLGQATYVNACADEQSRGIFNGIFFSIFQASQVLSSLIATYVLGIYGEFTLYSILLGFGTVALIMMSFIQPPIPYDNSTDIQEQKDVEPEETLSESLTRLIQTLRDQKYYFLFAGLLFSGITVYFYVNSLGTIIASIFTSEPENIANQKASIVFLVLAFFEVGAGITMGRLADKYDKIQLLGKIIIVNEVAVFLAFLCYTTEQYFFGILAGAVFGFGDTGINTMLNVVVGSRFNASPIIFSCYRLIQASGGLFVSLVGIFFLSSPILMIMVIAAALFVIQALFYHYYPKDDEKAKDYVSLNEDKIMIELDNVKGSTLGKYNGPKRVL